MNCKVNVIGLGYIGLPTSLSLAANNIEVIGSDYNENLIRKLNAGAITFEERGLLELFNKAIENHITFTTSYEIADIYIVAVPTPYIKESKRIDTVFLENAVAKILETMGRDATIIIESTISPGTIDKVIRPLINKAVIDNPEKEIHLVHAPERILPGNMLYELENNDRTIGVDDAEIGKKVKELYQSFCKSEIVITDIKTAEMTKVIENTYRDINIAFANELTKICYYDNMDVYKIIEIANRHPRVNILKPGPGVGGHCISVDPWFLVGDYPGLTNLITAARKINDSMPEFVLERIHEIMKENGMKDVSKIGFYGLAYKENVDDTRESPTLQLLESMEKHLAFGAKVYDPYVKSDIVENQCHDFEFFLKEIDFLVIMTAHEEIREKRELIKQKLVLDTRNIWKDSEFYKL